MLFNTDKITFEVVRGDTFILPLELNCGELDHFVKYDLTENDAIYIGIMKPNEPFEDATIRSKITHTDKKDSSGNPLFIINSNLTEKLHPGKYYISIKFSDGNIVETLVNQKLFFVTGSDFDKDIC